MFCHDYGLYLQLSQIAKQMHLDPVLLLLPFGYSL